MLGLVGEDKLIKKEVSAGLGKKEVFTWSCVWLCGRDM